MLLVGAVAYYLKFGEAHRRPGPAVAATLAVGLATIAVALVVGGLTIRTTSNDANSSDDRPNDSDGSGTSTTERERDGNDADTTVGTSGRPGGMPLALLDGAPPPESAVVDGKVLTDVIVWELDVAGCDRERATSSFSVPAGASSLSATFALADDSLAGMNVEISVRSGDDVGHTSIIGDEQPSASVSISSLAERIDISIEVLSSVIPERCGETPIVVVAFDTVVT